MKILKYLFIFPLALGITANAQTTETKPAPAKKLIHKASIAGKSNGNVSRNDLLTSKGILTSAPDHHIVEFKMTILGRDGEDMEFYNDKDGTLTENMRAELKGAEPGSKVSFEGIMCADSTNKPHKMNSISFLLK
jgi:hypothetical protein